MLVNQVEDQLVAQNTMVLTPVKLVGGPLAQLNWGGLELGWVRAYMVLSQIIMLFKDDIELPEEWDTSSETVRELL